MVEIQFNGKPIKFKTNWYDLTLGDFLAIRRWKTNDTIELLALCSGQPYEEWQRTKQKDVEYKIVPLLGFLSESFELNALKVPESLKFGDVTALVPKDLTLEMLGQKLDFQERMTTTYNQAKADTNGKVSEEVLTDDTLMEIMPFALAIYFVEKVTGVKYSDDEAEKFVPRILDLPLTEAYPVGRFFLMSYLESLNSKAKNYAPLIARMSAQLGLKSSPNSPRYPLLTRLVTGILRATKRLNAFRTRLRSSNSNMTKK